MCKGSGSKSTTATTAPDANAYSLYNNLLNTAQGVASTPYEAYGGQLVAPVNQQQMLGINNINSAMPLFNQAAGIASNIATPLTQQDIQQYQNPYTQNVVDATQAQFNAQNEGAQQKLLGQAAAQGALGGNRMGVAEAELARNQQLAQAPTIAGLYSNSYNSGVNTALQMKDLMSRGVQGTLSAAQGLLGGAGAQIGAGSLQQQTAQAQNEADYNQWQNMKAYPFQTTQWLANLGTGVGSQMGGTSTTTPPPPNTMNQILGGATTGLGILGGTGAFGAAGWLTPMLAGLASGGRVNGYYAGGGVVPEDVIPESDDTLLAQQDQLLNGERGVQMFPKGTPELPMPEGLGRAETARGAFHFDPSRFTAQGVAGASNAGRENELLDLGPFSKADIVKLIEQGAKPLVLVERTPDGVEVRAALGAEETLPAQREAMERAKSPENKISVEEFGDVVEGRQGGDRPVGLAAGGTAQKKMGFTPYGGAQGFVPTPDFNMVRGSGAPKPPSVPSETANPASKLGNLGGLFPNNNPTGVGNHTPGGYSAAFPDPGPSSYVSYGGLDVPVFGTPPAATAARGGAIGVAGLDPSMLKEVYGVDRVPGFDSGGAVYEPDFNFEGQFPTGGNWAPREEVPIGLAPQHPGWPAAAPKEDTDGRYLPNGQKLYRNNEPSPLDPPSGEERDAMIRTVLAEAGNQGPVGMQAVANVIRNRAVNGGYGGDTAEGVVTKPNQFEPWNTAAGRARMASYDPSSPAYKEAAAAVDRTYQGFDPTKGATHFYAPGTQAALGRRAPSWDDGTGNDIGDHRFFGGAGQNEVAAGKGPAVGVASAYADEDGERPTPGAFSSVDRRRANGLAPASYWNETSPQEKPGVDWSSNGKLWPSLMAAGLGMMASRSPYFGVGIGEGGLAGVQAYSQMRDSERQHGLSRERLGLEAKRLQQSADVEARRAREAEWPYTRLTAAQQAELMKPVQVGMDDYGRPISAMRDPKTGRYRIIDSKTGKFRDEFDSPGTAPGIPQAPQAPGAPGVSAPPGQPQPLPAGQQEAAVGDDKVPVNARLVSGNAVGVMRDPAAGEFNENVLDAQPPKIANQVRAIARGIEKPPSLERKNPYNQFLMEKVREYSPDFDATMFARRQRTANEFAVGVASRNLAATKTLAGHLEHLYETAKKLDNSGYPAWNSVWQGAARQGAGSKETQELLKEYEANKKAVADEAAKVFAGQSSALADREEWEKLFNVADPKNVQMAAIRKIVNLVDSRLNAMSDAYNAGMSTRHGAWELIEPKYKDIFDRMRKAGNEGVEEKKAAPQVAKPSMDEFLAKAKQANPNASEETLRQYYNKKYGAQ